MANRIKTKQSLEWSHRAHRLPLIEALEARQLLSTYTVPASIAADGSAEVTQSLLNYFATVPDGTAQNPSTIVFQANGDYWIDGTLSISGRNYLTFEGNGAKFEARDPLATGNANLRTRSQWSITGASGHITLQNMTVWGADRLAGIGRYDSTREAQHAFSITGQAHDVLVENVWAGYVYGDTVSVNGGHDILVENSHFEHADRQAMSVSTGYDIAYMNNYVGDGARSLLDVEPYASDWVVDHFQFVGNTTGTSANAWINLGGSGYIGNVLIANNNIQGTHGLPLINSSNVEHAAIVAINNAGNYATGTTTAFGFSNTDGVLVAGNNLNFTAANNSNTAVGVTNGEGAIIGDNQFIGALNPPYVDTTNDDVWMWANSLLNTPGWTSHTTRTNLAGGGYGITITGYSDAAVTNGTVRAILRQTRGTAVLTHGSLTTAGEMAAVLLDAQGNLVSGWSQAGAGSYLGTPLPLLNAPPTILQQPTNAAVPPGAAVTFSLYAEGSAPLGYQWLRNGVFIPDATASAYSTTAGSADNGAVYTCIVANKYGSVTSDPVTLSVGTVNPSITADPQAASVATGQTSAFTVAAVGSGPLGYQWQKKVAGGAFANIAGATATTYVTPATSSADNGSAYRCLVSNVSGSTPSAAATLTVTAGSITETWTGANNDPWPNAWTKAGSAKTYINASGQGRIEWNSAGSTADMIRNDFAALDSDQSVQVFLSNINTSTGVVYSRYTSATANYGVRLRYNDQIQLYEGAATLTSALPVVDTSGVWVTLRMRTLTEGTSVRIQAKVWSGTGADPDPNNDSAWTINYLDATPQTGTAVGLGGVQNSSSARYVLFDNYSATPVATLPAAPTNLAAALVADNQARLTWQDNSANESGFLIQRSLDNVSFSDLAVVGYNVTAYNDPGLAPSTRYYYRLIAYNTQGFSPATASVHVDTPAPALPTFPSNPQTLTATAVSSAQINLAWADSSGLETGYRVERSPNGHTNWTIVATVDAGVTSYADSALPASTRFWYRVTALRGSAPGLYAQVKDATTADRPGTIREYFTSDDYTSFPAKWTHEGALSEAASIQIYNSAGRIVSASGAANRLFSFVNTVNAENTDQVATFTVSSNAGGFGLLARRADSASTTYYFCEIVNSGTSSHLNIYRTLAGATTQIASSANYTILSGYRYRVRFVTETFNGSTRLAAKIWLLSQAEPTSWTITATDSTAALQGVSGRFGTVSKLFTNGRTVGADDYLSYYWSGAVAASAPDLEAASDSGFRNDDNRTSVTAPTFAGTANSGSLVTILSGGLNVGSTIAEGGAYRITTSALADGLHQMTATATDPLVLSTATSSALSLTIDTVAPVVAINPVSATYKAPATITGTASDVTSGLYTIAVTITRDTPNHELLASGNATINGGTWSFAYTPAEVGAQIVSIIATDNAGNAATASRRFTIAKPTATVTLTPASLSATYDGVAKTAVATTNPTGLALTFTYNGSAAAPISAGSYAVVATITDPNYQGFASGTLVIAKATLSVRADDKAKAPGAANPPLTYSLSGFVNGQTVATSGVSGAAVLSTTATTSSPIGVYPITPALGTLSAGNYTFAFVNGSLAVTGLQINSGDAQRSKIAQIKVVFAQPIAQPTPIFTLKIHGTATILNPAFITKTDVSDGGRCVTYTLATKVVNNVYLGLNDGIYDLTVADAPTGQSVTKTFHRLFGDSNGDGSVSNLEITSIRSGAYLWYLDYDGDGIFTALDYNQATARRSVHYTY